MNKNELVSSVAEKAGITKINKLARNRWNHYCPVIERKELSNE